MSERTSCGFEHRGGRSGAVLRCPPVTVDELRGFVLGLDGAVEGAHQSGPDVRRGGKIVVNLDEAAGTITLKLDLAEQAALVAQHPEAFTLPGGWAKHGWTTISLERAGDDEIRALVEDAWERAAPRRRPS